MPQSLSPLLLVICYAALLAAAVSGASLPAPNCPDKCGDIDIPYSFGIGTNCSLPGFHLTCDNTTSPAPSLLTGNVKVENITLETAQMVAYTFLTYSCSPKDSNNKPVPTWQNMSFDVSGTPFLLSPVRNVFTAVGCSAVAKVKGRSGDDYLTGCITTCTSVNDTGDDGTPCAGQGCCEASLTPRLDQVSVSWNIREGDNPVQDNPCQYAFVSTQGWYSYKKRDLIGNMTFANEHGTGNVVPIILDWAIRDGNCTPALEGAAGACVSAHSYCVNASHGAQGYFCNCSDGYAGNPYIKNGCTSLHCTYYICYLWN